MKISNIEESTFKVESLFWTFEDVIITSKDGTTFEGVIITLEDGTTFKIGIDYDQQCCENAGYITSHDNYEDFIGADFLDYWITTKELCTIEDVPEIYEGSMLFYTIATNRGNLQFVAYNEHNGYYAHDVVIVKDSKIVEQESI